MEAVQYRAIDFSVKKIDFNWLEKIKDKLDEKNE